MKLDRNINADGLGKYAILNLRRLGSFIDTADPFADVAEPIATALKTLEKAGILDWGRQGSESEFFLIKLKDKYAQAGLAAYAREAVVDDPEYGGEIWEMARRAGPASPFCKKPD